MTTTLKRGKNLELEGLRGACAFLVLINHIGQHLPPEGVFFKYVRGVLEPLGGIAVMLFFILSGFVIGWSHDEVPSKDHVRNYLLKRLIRLLPIYIICLLISFAVADESIFSQAFFFHLCFMQGTWVPVVASNGPLWSLHFEAIYYVLFIVVWLLPSSTTIFAFLAGCAALFSIWISSDALNVLALFVYWLFGLACARQSVFINWCVDRSGRTSFWVPLFLFWAYQTAGALSGIVKKVGGSNFWAFQLVLALPLVANMFLSIFNLRLRRRVALPFYITAVCITILGYVYGLTSGKFFSLVSYPVSLLFFVLAVMATLFKVPAPRADQWSLLGWWGGISYALYLVHHPLLDFVASRTSFNTLLLMVAVVCAAAAAVGLAFLLEGFVQPSIAKPLRRLTGVGRGNRARTPLPSP